VDAVDPSSELGIKKDAPERKPSTPINLGQKYAKIIQFNEFI
jgi:hypothetical protein